MSHDFPVAVVGGGATGLTAALALARGGVACGLIAPPPGGEDGRTAALIGSSIRLLRGLGVWDGVAGEAAPLTAMRIVDDTGSLFRAPTVTFRAAEIDLDSFGENIANDTLVGALAEAVRAEPGVTWLEGMAERCEIASDSVCLTVGGATITTSVAVAADGRRSRLREQAGIGVDAWSYPQKALVANFAHEAAHETVSTEFHTGAGPFTLVPLPGDRSSVVWVDRPAVIDAAMQLDAAALSALVTEKAHWLLGQMRLQGSARSYPLEGLLARKMANGRLALVGEAAHSLPPIAAQGLNLGLRDVAMLAELLSDSAIALEDPAEALARYDAARRADVFSRTYAVDMLNRSLLGGLLPLGPVRAAGLGALSRSGTLRRALMRRGLSPLGHLPRAMRADAAARP